MEECGCLLGCKHFITTERLSPLKTAFSKHARKQNCTNWGICNAFDWCAKRLLGVLRIISFPHRLGIAAQAPLWIWSRTSLHWSLPPGKCRWCPCLSKEFRYSAPLLGKHLAWKGQRKFNGVPCSLRAAPRGREIPFQFNMGCFERQRGKRPIFQNCW